MNAQVKPQESGKDLKSLRDDQLIAAYRNLRDRRDEAKKQFTESQKPALALMNNIENELLGRLQERGANNVQCKTGTAYIKTDTTYKVEDWQVALTRIIETGAWDMLERRISKEAAAGYHEEHGSPFPGVSMKSEVYVNINAPRSKGD